MPSVPAATAALTTPQPVTNSGSTAVQAVSVVATPQDNDERYKDGMVIWETPEGNKVPFLLKFNVNTQLRYLNTMSSPETFTDHLGTVREVHTRNDITVNRAMFILGGYVFDKRLRYSFTVWTSAGAASIIVAGNIGWQFNKALAITGDATWCSLEDVIRWLPLARSFWRLTGAWRTTTSYRVHPGCLGEWRTREGTELSGVRRQWSQYFEYLGKQDRHASAGIRQCLVGAAGGLRGTRQSPQHVR